MRVRMFVFMGVNQVAMPVLVRVLMAVFVHRVLPDSVFRLPLSLLLQGRVIGCDVTTDQGASGWDRPGEVVCNRSSNRQLILPICDQSSHSEHGCPKNQR